MHQCRKWEQSYKAFCMSQNNADKIHFASVICKIKQNFTFWVFTLKLIFLADIHRASICKLCAVLLVIRLCFDSQPFHLVHCMLVLVQKLNTPRHYARQTELFNACLRCHNHWANVTLYRITLHALFAQIFSKPLMSHSLTLSLSLGPNGDCNNR
jgi:hypothetical protein